MISDYPIFICGFPKSGTTLVSRLFSNMADTHIDNELHMASHCLNMVRSVLNSGGVKTDVGNILSFRLTELAENDFELFYQQVKGFFQNLHTGYHYGWRWGNNCKPTIDHVKTIKRMFPMATIIYMLRDPRDVWASVKHAQWPGQNHFNDYEFFKKRFREIYNKSLVPEVHTLLYRDLVADPQTAFTLIDREFHPNYLQGTGQVFQYRTLPLQMHTTFEDGILSSRNNRYKTELTPEEIKDIEKTFQDVIAKYFD